MKIYHEACPLCGGKLKGSKLHEYKNIIFCDRGAVALGPVMLTILRAVKRPGGATVLQLEEITGTAATTIKSQVCHLNKKLNDIGQKIVNVSGTGQLRALYVLREELDS